ncbi:MAG: mechanosensitive ion channel family protein, partial [Dehalococcoidia bacterium]
MEAFLANLGLNGPLWSSLAAGVIFLSSVVLAAVFNWGLFPLILRATNWIPTNLDKKLVGGLRLPLTLGIVLLGAYIALSLLPLLGPELQRTINTVASVLALFLVVATVASVVSGGFRWYMEDVAPHTGSNFDDRLAPMLRRITVALVYALGTLMILDHLNISISPLIAGLGLGGLAVALALQPTLSNLFAGTYVMTEGVITPGDYVELENGIAGYVVDVSWRSTRLRTWYNNLVVVPNARFADTIITNYQAPVPAVNVFLTCGVSYDSDLYLVEQVCKEVMNELLANSPDAVREYGGWFGFDSFEDSNVSFWLFVQARNRLASFRLRTALMQSLHARLRQEGIEINYPVRMLRFPEEWGPEGLMRRNGSQAMTRPPSRGQRRRGRRPQRG